MSLSRRYARDDQDACSLHNTSFTKIVLNLNKYREEIPFKNWMRRIAINHIIDQIRHEKTYQIKLSHARSHQGNGHGTSLNLGEQKLNFDGLLTLLDILPVATRNVFNLFAIDEYSHKEIAEQLDISVGTSKWHVAHARKALQVHLSNTNYDVPKTKHSIILNVKNS
jgi:RNA polymerase sigma-70 factor (ECF subfamily)